MARIDGPRSLPLLVLLVAGACATKPAAVPSGKAPLAVQEPQSAPEPKNFLWEVTSGDDRAFLLGSIHVGAADIYPMPEAVEQAFSKSDVLAVEVDIDALDNTRMQARVLRAATYPRGQTLSRSISPERYEAVERVFEQMGIDARMMEPFRPWFVAMTLTMGAMAQAGYSPDMGIDRHFLQRARERQMPIAELESADFQIDLLSGFEDELQELFLYSTLLTLPMAGSEIRRMIEAWRGGDADRMERILREAETQLPEARAVYERINVDRNPAMAETVEGFLSSGRTHFVVVGAAHLVGEDGIVRLLERKGYAVTQR